MKIHLHLIEQLAKDLALVFFKNSPAEKVLEQSFKIQRKWGSRDRRFYAENFFEVVRWWRKIWYCLGEEAPASGSEIQLIRAWACYWILTGQELPENFSDLNIVVDSVKAAAVSLSTNPDLLAIQESIPDWLHHWGLRERNERWPSILKSLNQPVSIDLRTNTLKTTREELLSRLRKEGFEVDAVPAMPDALVLLKRKNLLSHPSFLEGHFELQDRGSQKIAPMLPSKPGDFIIDACAGGGGKSLHLASLMKNQGQILSMDIHEWKLKRLEERARRNGVKIIETRKIEGDQSIEALKESASALLLDVPCSGLGVLRRHADRKWKLQKSEVEEVLLLQKRILSLYSKMVRPGGHLLYATCSVMNSENQKQVESFLNSPEAEAQSWRQLQELQIDPDQNMGDGFFAALLQRK